MRLLAGCFNRVCWELQADQLWKLGGHDAATLVGKKTPKNYSQIYTSTVLISVHHPKVKEFRYRHTENLTLYFVAMTTTDRLRLLEPLANHESLPTAEVRRHVFRFLHGFVARGLRLPKDEGELRSLHRASAADLKEIADRVADVFSAALIFEAPQEGLEDTTPDDIRMPLEFKSLRFGAFRPKGRQHSRAEWIVEAENLSDLVPFLVMYLLVTETARIIRCHAPALRNWKGKCDRILIWSGVGRPRLVCDSACGARVKAKKAHEAARKERKAWQSTHPHRPTRHRAAR